MVDIKILHIATEIKSSEQLENELLNNPFCQFEISSSNSIQNLSKELENRSFQVIIIDLKKTNADESLSHIHQMNHEIPILVRILKKDSAIGLKALEFGVQDFVYADGNEEFITGKTIYSAYQSFHRIKKVASLHDDLKKLEHAVDQSANVIVITDTFGEIVFVNKKFEELTGYTKEEAIGNSPSVLKSGRQSKAYYQDLWETISSGKAWQGEFENRKKDGSLFWERAIITPITNDQGVIQNYIAIKEDITSLRLAIKKGEVNESRLNAILESLDDMVFIIDDKGCFVDFFESSLNEVPYVSKDEFIGKHYSKVLPQPVALRIKNALQRLVNGEGVQVVEYEQITSGIQSYWRAKITPLKGPELGFTMVTENVTEDRIKEHKLLMSEEKYKNHSEALPIILWTTNVDGVGNYQNKLGDEFYGKKIDEIRTCYWHLVHPEDRSFSRKKWRKVLQANGIFQNIERHKNALGEYRWLQLEANPVFSKEQHILGWVGISKDVHEEVETKKHNEDLLFHLTERVKEASAIYSVSRTILEYANDLDQAFLKYLDIIPLGFLNPELTSVKIIFKEKVYQKRPLKYSNRISSPITVNRLILGEIIVGIAKKDHQGKELNFLKEENRLLSLIAQNTSMALEREEATQKLAANELKYRLIFDNLQEGYLLMDYEGTILDSNPEALRLIGYEGEKLLEKLEFQDFFLLDFETLKKQIKGGILRNYLVSMRKMDGHSIQANFNFRVVKTDSKSKQIEATFRDVTRTTKMNELVSATVKLYEASQLNMEELIQVGIDTAVEIMDSKAGFYHHVNIDQNTVKLVQWSKGTKEVCKVPQLVPVYKIDDAGIWVECIQTLKPVIHNDFKRAKNKKGLPQGHFVIERDLEIPILNQGKPVAILGVANKSSQYTDLDVSVLESYASLFHSLVEKKQLEEEYLSTLESFKKSQEAASIGAWRYDLVYETTWWSDTMFDIYKIPKSQGIPQKDWLNYTHPEDREHQLKAFNDSIASGSYECEFRIIRPDGEIAYVYAKSSVVYDQLGKPLKHNGILQDVSTTKKMMHLFQEKSLQFESIVDTLDGFVYRIYKDGAIEYLSSTFEEMLGYDVEAFKMSIQEQGNPMASIENFIHKDDREEQLALMETHFNSGEDFNLTYRLLKKEGGFIWVSDRGKVIQNENGDLVMQGFVYDITDRVQAEEHLLNVVMKTSDGEKARISKEIHDSLQQTLTIAALNLDFVKKQEGQLSEQVKSKYNLGMEYLSKSMDETRFIAHRLMPKGIEDFGLEPVLRDMVNDLNRSTDIEFEFITNMQNRRLQVPLALNLFKLVQEAVNNIIKHAQCKTVTIQYLNVSNIIQLSIEDDGIGFQPKNLGQGNLGFGLASMKSRAAAAGAELVLDSIPGHGTTILVEIPFTQNIAYYE